MKTSFLLLSLVPALFLTSCYVTPEGGPYGHHGHGPPPRRDLGGYRGDVRPAPDRGRDHHDHDHGHRGDDRRGDDRGRFDRSRDPNYRFRGAPGGYGDARGSSSRPSGAVSLPRGARRVEHRGNTYYVSGDSWYRSSSAGYVRVSRPY